MENTFQFELIDDYNKPHPFKVYGDGAVVIQEKDIDKIKNPSNDEIPTLLLVNKGSLTELDTHNEVKFNDNDLFYKLYHLYI